MDEQDPRAEGVIFVDLTSLHDRGESCCRRPEKDLHVVCDKKDLLSGLALPRVFHEVPGRSIRV